MTRARSASRTKHARLEPTRPHVAGIDIGACEHWVCGPEDDHGERPVRSFGATTTQLQQMAAWLLAQQVQSVAMESTYIYWIPVYEVLEQAGLEVVLVNARTLKNVPGRKTDVADCQWLQLLHSCGLLRGSFRPKDAICRLRALQRQRSNFIAERSRAVQWMQKSLDQMNVRVHRAVTELTGTTGMAIVRAIVSGERDPMRLAQHRDPRCRKSIAEIAEQLTGNWRDDHLFNLDEALRLYDAVNGHIERYDAQLLREIEKLQPEERRDEPCPPHSNAAKQRVLNKRGEQPLRATLWRFAGVDLTSIDGISTGSAQAIITELGTDILAFPSEKHFVSWLRLCPRVPISGGKPLHKRRNGIGASRLTAVFRMAAVSVQRSQTALGAAYRRMARRKGAAQAVFVTARTIAICVYRLLRYGQPYLDIGQAAYEARFREQRIAALHQNAKDLGFNVLPAASPG